MRLRSGMKPSVSVCFVACAPYFFGASLRACLGPQRVAPYFIFSARAFLRGKGGDRFLLARVLPGRLIFLRLDVSWWSNGGRIFFCASLSAVLPMGRAFVFLGANSPGPPDECFCWRISGPPTGGAFEKC